MKRSVGIARILLASLGLWVAACGGESASTGDDKDKDRKWVTNPSGLKYEDQVEGKGEPAQKGDRLEVYYTGWLKSNGQKFDSTQPPAQPFVLHNLGAGQVIKGWDEGLQGMRVGGKRLLWIPAALAYGESGSGRAIPPNSDLMFEVEVVKVRQTVRDLKMDEDKDREWKTTQSGLKYYEIKEGTGPAVKSGDQVEVHYSGWLQQNGKKFDSSVDRNEPFSVSVGAGRVIKGWDEGLQGMKAGGKRRLWIPWALAYGEKGRGPIPPKADLIFDVELLKIK